MIDLNNIKNIITIGNTENIKKILDNVENIIKINDENIDNSHLLVKSYSLNIDIKDDYLPYKKIQNYFENTNIIDYNKLNNLIIENKLSQRIDSFLYTNNFNTNINTIFINDSNIKKILISLGNLINFIEYIIIDYNIKINNESSLYLKNFKKNIIMDNIVYTKKKDIKYNILVAITTYNEIDITEKCILSLKKNPNYDIILIDDYSERDDIKTLSKKYKIPFIGKIHHKGLTHSWNIAYKYFRESNYDILYISNNDIIFPTQTLDFMTNELFKSKCCVVVPSSTVKGAGKGCCQKLQGISKISGFNLDIDNPDNVQKVQDFLLENNIFQNQYALYFTGFLFGMKRDISKFEFKDGTLFDSTKINLCNEIEFYNRINTYSKELILYTRNAFVYHYKAITIDVKKRDNLKLIENKYKRI